MNITNLHARPTVKASGPSVIMVAGFIVFLVADGTPGGLTGMQGFLWGAGIALACVVALVIAAIVSLRGRNRDAAIEGVETVRAAMHSNQ